MRLSKFRKPYEIYLNEIPQQLPQMSLKITSATHHYSTAYLVPFKNQYSKFTKIKVPVAQLCPQFKKSYVLQYALDKVDEQSKKIYFKIVGISVIPSWKPLKFKNIYHSYKDYIFNCFGSLKNARSKKSVLSALQTYLESKQSLILKIEAILNNELENVYNNVAARQCRAVYVSIKSKIV